jgi:hypothetical protein
VRLTILAASLLGGFAGSPTLAQQPAQQSLIGLSVEKIYARPGLAAPLVRGIAWSPDGKLLSYFHRSGSGASAKTELYSIDVAKSEFPGRLLVGADKL